MLKFFELNSIRYRMLSGFLFLTLIIFIVGVVSVLSLDTTSRFARVHSKINQLQVYTLNLIKTDNDFYDFEATNENYFKTHQSNYLKRRDSLLQLIKAELKIAIQKSASYNEDFHHNLVEIDSLFFLYNSKFDKLESLIYSRGFKDFGLEGDMRIHAHALEFPELKMNIHDVLSLRRNEKDFLLRHDLDYIARFNELSNLIAQKLSKDTVKYSKALFHLRQYKHFFNQRVLIEKQIGLSSSEGYRSELNNLTIQLSKKYFSLSEYSGEAHQSVDQKARVFYVFMITGAILFSLVSGFWISKRLSEPIAQLSKRMNLTTDYTKKLELSNAADEINTLTHSFNRLIDQTHRQVNEIEEKSALLENQNKELNKLNQELDHFLYSTAHDLRSPLTSLQGIVQLMRIENHQENLITYLDMMQNSIKRQEDFIAQIVNYAKNNKLEIDAERLNLKQMILDIFQNHEFVEGATAIDKYINVREDAPFYSDRNRMTIVFNNLISNAIRYSDPKKKDKFIQIRIHTSFKETTIEFSDNGIGIEHEHLDKIFDMFYRAHVTSKGSGLGLFIFKEAIQKLNGLVTVESEEKKGTKFFIQIPNLYAQLELSADSMSMHEQVI